MIDTAGAKELLTSDDLGKLQKHAKEYFDEYNEMDDEVSQDTIIQVLKLLILLNSRILQLQSAGGASDSDMAETLATIGKVWNFMGEADKAIGQLAKATSLAPSNTDALQALAKAYSSKSMYQEAIATQEKAIGILSGDDKALAYGRLAAIYEGKADFAAEQSALRSGVKSLADASSLTAAILYKQLGATEEKLGNYNDAVEQFTKCYEIYKSKFGEDDKRTEDVDYLIEMAKQYMD